MPLFTLTPGEIGIASKDVVAGDTGQLLGIIHRLGWKSAHVAQDGRYLFSLALNPEGYWSLTTKVRLQPALRLVS